jgi:hypothetical protein
MLHVGPLHHHLGLVVLQRLDDADLLVFEEFPSVLEARLQGLD